MTQAPPSSSAASATTATDSLVARYHAAQAQLDAHAADNASSSSKPGAAANTPVPTEVIATTRPSPHVRANVLAYAEQLAAQRAKAPPTESTGSVAANTPANTPTNSTINSIATRAVFSWATGHFDAKKSPANDSHWKILALACVAIFGLSGLLFMQWDSAAPEDKNAAFSTESPPTAIAQKAHTVDAAPQAASAPPAAPAAASVVAPAALAKPPSTRMAQAKTAPAPTRPSTGQAKDQAPAPAEPKPSTELAAAERADTEAAANTSTDKLARAKKSTSTEGLAGMVQRIAKDEAASAEPTVSASAEAVTAKPAMPAATTAQAMPSTQSAALLTAIRNKDTAALQTALRAGADKNTKRNGTPALTLCVQEGQADMVQLLLSAGADVNAVDAQGITALAHARARGLNSIVSVLLSSGAK